MEIQCLLLSILLSVVLDAKESFAGQESVKVDCDHGPVKGFVQKIKVDKKEEVSVETFLGIPYASPPIGDLRFQSTQLINPWDEELDATNWPPLCPQEEQFLEQFETNNKKMDEDCLFLNIWSPKTDGRDKDLVTSPKPIGEEDDDDDSDLKPVMVFIPGGGFMAGGISLNLHDGSVLAAHGDIIVVTIQYRIGPLGFLYTGDSDEDVDTAPGNMGLWDIIFGLKFVHENIESFGGNPNQVTLAGDGAGAVAVSLLLLSPVMPDHFVQNAIIIGGSGLGSWFVDKKADSVTKAKRASVLLGCGIDAEKKKDGGDKDEKRIQASQKLFDCFNDKSVQEISEAFINRKTLLADDNRTQSYFISLPIYGETLLPDKPYQLMHEAPKSKNILMGITNFEGNILDMVHKSLKKRGKSNDFYDNLLKSHNMKLWIRNLYRLMRSEVPTLDTDEIERLVYQYFDPRGTQATWRSSLSDFYGDFNIVCPNVLQARQMTSNNEVFHFVYTHSSADSGAGNIEKDIKLTTKVDNKAGHSSHLPFLFGLPHKSPDKYQDIDVRASTEFMKFISKFVYMRSHDLLVYDKNYPVTYEVNPRLMRENQVDETRFIKRYKDAKCSLLIPSILAERTFDLDKDDAEVENKKLSLNEESFGEK